MMNHKGPFALLTYGTSKGSNRILADKLSSEEVEPLARTFLADPRDTIDSIHVWSNSEEQFIMTFSRKDLI